MRGERREVLWADFDALDHTALLWWPEARADDERAGGVRRAIAERLSPKQREVVEAYFFEGLSEPAIARRLGIKQQVVHKRIHGVRRDGRAIGGALRRLAEALAPLVRS
jgi:DNA-directed RNA polymerase specialized sigma24 family protein